MAKPGPAKGSGGRPRKGSSVVPTADGYKRVTVGSKKNPRRVYEHRAKTGAGKGNKAGSTGVVHHRDGNRTNNSASNLQRTTKAENNRKKKR